jgi:hypothetical protein
LQANLKQFLCATLSVNHFSLVVRKSSHIAYSSLLSHPFQAISLVTYAISEVFACNIRETLYIKLGFLSESISLHHATHFLIEPILQ